MKRRLNILCVIVILVLGYSVVEATYYLVVGVKAGVEAGVSAGTSVDRQREVMNLKYINLMPENLATGTGDFFMDSVYNEKSGKYVPASYGSLIASIDTGSTVSGRLTSTFLNLIHFGVSIWAIVLFIRLVIAINKSDIFNWKNVRRLRRLGLALIISFFVIFLSAYFTFREVGEVFSVPGYKLSFSDMVNTTTLVLGISTLIVAEVFAIGLRMKEEQDLTI